MAWSPTQSGLAAFDGDALSAYRQTPLVCVLPRNRRAGQRDPEIMPQSEGVPIVPRGAGTSLSGGALPREDGILIGMGRMKRILEIDYENRCVVVEPGVTNLTITRAVEANGFYYAPDPSSQIACTIGGNVAENSGGLHCLKYGLTTNNLLGVDLGAAGRRDRHPGRQVAARRAGLICWAWSPARKACWAWWWK